MVVTHAFLEEARTFRLKNILSSRGTVFEGKWYGKYPATIQTGSLIGHFGSMTQKSSKNEFGVAESFLRSLAIILQLACRNLFPPSPFLHQAHPALALSLPRHD